MSALPVSVETGTKASMRLALRSVHGAIVSTVATRSAPTGASARQDHRGVGPHSPSASAGRSTRPLVRVSAARPTSRPARSAQRQRCGELTPTAVAATAPRARTVNSVSVSSEPPTMISGTHSAPTASAISPTRRPHSRVAMKPMSATAIVPSSASATRPAVQRSEVSGAETA